MSPARDAVKVKHLPAPCAACPFSRSVRPGALGGSEPETYIGQIFGPFVLPCHKACDFDDPNWKREAINTPQCAGAAVFRANTGAEANMPAGIHRLPPDDEAVFSSSVEFLAHHKRISESEARMQLLRRPPFTLMNEQLARIDNITYSKEAA